MKTDKISFGTNPKIGEISARTGLSKYSKSLSKGVLDAFTTLSKNGIDDEVLIGVGHKKGAKLLSTDTLEIVYIKNNSFISSEAFSPKSLSKKTAKTISDLILATYERLKKSTELVSTMDYYPNRLNGKISNEHRNIIRELCDKFGYDDWTCA